MMMNRLEVLRLIKSLRDQGVLNRNDRIAEVEMERELSGIDGELSESAWNPENDQLPARDMDEALSRIDLD